MLQAEAAHFERKELELASQIKGLSEALVSVRCSLSRMRACTSGWQKRFSPAARLPDETLLAIFREAVFSQDVDSKRRVESAISCVSRRWRSIALHTARLWTRVCVTPETDEREIKVHLMRSVALPLDVEVWGWWDYRDSFLKPLHFECTLATALPSASRWRRLAIGASCDSVLTCLSYILHNVGSLRALQEVAFEAQEPGQMCPPALLMGNLAPKLVSVDVENIALATRSPCFRHHDVMCFMGVNHLTLRVHEGDARALKTTTEFQAFRALLLQMPNLLSLSLYGEPVCITSVPSPEDEENSTVVLPLPRLKTLILHPHNVQPRYLRNLIAMIAVPNLRHFELVYPDTFSRRGQDISDLLLKGGSTQPTPRFPLVEHLVLNNAADIIETAAFLVQAFPCVRRLTISGANVGIFNQHATEGLDAHISNGEVHVLLPTTNCPSFLQ